MSDRIERGLINRARRERPLALAIGHRVLGMSMPDNDSGEQTVRGYLVALLRQMWREQEGFSAKRPFGNSGWPIDLYAPLATDGVHEGDMDDVIDWAIQALGEAK